MGCDIRKGRTDLTDFVYGKGVSDWVLRQIKYIDCFDENVAIGAIVDGKLVAGAVFDNYRPNSRSICASIAINGALNKAILREFFSYPFTTSQCGRITTYVDDRNTKAIEFNRRLGFVKEGIMRQASTDGHNIIIFGMLLNECRWIK